MPTRDRGESGGGEAAGERLGRAFFAQDPAALARALIGHRLVRVMPGGERLAGVIVETEAYLGVPDRAAHSFGGRRTARTEPMFGPPGTAYVYFTYGKHHCMNVAAGEEGEPVAVLLRALEPVEGLETMRAHRARRSAGRGVVEGERPPSSGGRPMRDRDLCSGPGKLCQALAIDRSFSGGDLAANGALFIEAGRADFTPLAAEQLVNTPRIGVDYAGAEWSSAMLRWYLRESPHVSVR